MRQRTTSSSSGRPRRSARLCLALVAPLVGCAAPAAVTPLPATPVTPAGVPTVRPPIDTATEPQNLSAMPGLDLAPSVAVHPTEGWAAVIWANQRGRAGEESDVYVKAQDPQTGRWLPAVGVNTTPAERYAGHPAIAIDQVGRIHAVFAQHGLQPHYSRSADGGRTWTDPEGLPPIDGDRGGMSLRAVVDETGRLHVLRVVSCGFDCYRTYHLSRAADAAPGSAWSPAVRPLPGSKHLRADLAVVGDTLVVAAACSDGCGSSRPVVATLSGGRWKVRHIGGNVTHAGWEINWISVVAAGDRRVCAAWGHYARSGNYSACSFDAASTWEDAKPIVETYPVGKDRAYVPALLYEPQTESVLAVQLYDQGGEPLTLYPIYSYRHLDRDYWVPDMAGRDDRHQPPLRIFNREAGTNRAQPPQGLRVAYAGTGLATLVWVERVGDEIEVYAGQLNPAALIGRS